MIDEASRKMATSVAERGRAAGDPSGDERRAARRHPRARDRAVRRGAVGDAAARRPRRRGDQDRGSGRSAATSAATSRRTRRARTRSSSRRSIATSRASRSTCGTRAATRVRGPRRASADAVFSNLRGDQPEKLGLRYRDLEHVNPSIVCCSLSGFGMTGPRVAEGAYDYDAAGPRGLAEPDRRARRPADEERSLAGRLLRRLRRGARARSPASGARAETGAGADIDLSLFEVALAQLTYVGDVGRLARLSSRCGRPHSAHQSIVPFQNFATLDGWLVVACPKQSLWERLCEAIDSPTWPATSASRRSRSRDRAPRRACSPIARADASRRERRPSGSSACRRPACRARPVNDVAAALADVQVAARRLRRRNPASRARHRARGCNAAAVRGTSCR